MRTAKAIVTWGGVFVALSLTLVGCGDKKDDDDAANAANLVGTWKSKTCESDTRTGDDGKSETTYSKTTATFTDTTLTLTNDDYDTDTTCSDTTKQGVSFKMEGTYVTGDKAASQTTVEGATSMDLKLTSAAIAFRRQDVVDALNGNGGYCGATVVKDTYIELSAAKCGDDAGGMEAGKTLYTIFKASESELYIGDGDGTTDGSAADKRNAKLDTVPMVKS